MFVPHLLKISAKIEELLRNHNVLCCLLQICEENTFKEYSIISPHREKKIKAKVEEIIKQDFKYVTFKLQNRERKLYKKSLKYLFVNTAF